MTTFDSSFFVNNRNRLRSIFTGTAPIVLTANGVLQQNSDNTFPFKQDSSFWYFTGIEDPGVILVMDKSRDYLITPAQGSYSEVADGIIDSTELVSTSGVEIVYDYQEGWRQLTSRLKRSLHVAIVAAPAPYIEELGFFTNPARAQLNKRIKDINPKLSLLDIREHIVKLRCIKQEPELDAMRSAIKITSEVIKKIQKKALKYNYEYEVEAEIIYEFRKHNASEAYSSIVAAGKNACTLHYHKNADKIEGSDLLLLDIGADVSHYAADITRTFSVNSKPSKRQKQIFDSVLDVQAYAFSLLKPGTMLKDYEKQVGDYMGEKLRELGLIKAIENDSVRKYFPHSTSHFLGLDPHDVGMYDQPLEENMVITVEPGIYVPEEGIGVRLEDDVLITKDGIKNLSISLPSKLI